MNTEQTGSVPPGPPGGGSELRPLDECAAVLADPQVIFQLR